MSKRWTALAYRTVTFAIIGLSLGLVFAGFIGWNLRADSILNIVRPSDALAFLLIGLGCAIHQDWNENR